MWFSQQWIKRKEKPQGEKALLLYYLQIGFLFLFLHVQLKYEAEIRTGLKLHTFTAELVLVMT